MSKASCTAPERVLACSLSLSSSPWSNKFFPEEEAEADATVPSGPLRALEEHANALFDAYRQQ